MGLVDRLASSYSNALGITLTIEEEEYLVRNLAISNPIEGPQILISFDYPTGDWETIRVLKKRWSFPKNEQDGVLLKEITFPGETSGQEKISDRKVRALTPYYYTIFTLFNSNWYADIATKVTSTPYQTGRFSESMWKMLPENLRRLDGQA